jgi:arabinan endo-1,5-alpha-L-arabinosidase
MSDDRLTKDRGRRTEDGGPRAEDNRPRNTAQNLKRLVFGLWSVVFALAACGGAQQASQPTPAPVATQPAATSAPAPTAGRPPIPTPGPDEFVNPVLDRNFPDPDILKVGDTYYAYATESDGMTVQTAKSTDLVSWSLVGNALIVLPEWVIPGRNWAPEVTSWDGGKTFVMYFTARDATSDRQCIGVATSDNPEGPFQGVGDTPLICQDDLGGSIDPSSFADDGARYVLWKNDGNCCGDDVHLYIQAVSADGLTLEGEPTQLITNDQPWEGILVEAPTLWKHDGKYYLFYSANKYDTVDYATGYAVAESVTGPYTKPGREPLLASDLQNGAALGPGGQDVVVDKDGDTWLVFHSWDSSASYRHMMIEELVWEGDTPVVKPPERGPQPKP